MPNSALLAISPLDGRYQQKLTPLQNIVSEWGLIRFRVEAEISWLVFLCNQKIAPAMSPEAIVRLQDIIHQFSVEEAEKIKTIEQQTRHDVKAVEYYIQEKCEPDNELKALIPWIHFGCTSEDINSTAYALMFKHGREILNNTLTPIVEQLQSIAQQHAELSMLARTHGQAASPTTLGKEFKNIVSRLQSQIQTINQLDIQAKFSGAVGNFNAHSSAFPNLDWPSLCTDFMASLSIHFNRYTTQIEPHDSVAEFWHNLSRINTILIDTCRDIWQYISLGYFIQKKKPGEVGSSTMPHKINPIDFENAEGNLGIANALAQHCANKLPISRLQRDLSDSTVQRNTGVIFGHSMLAYLSFSQGLSRLDINASVIAGDLENRWELLAEPIQTVLRKHGITDAYEQLKSLTRGEAINQRHIQDFIQQCDIPADDKQRLLDLTPSNYIGLASTLAKED